MAWVDGWLYWRMDPEERWWSYEWNFHEDIRGAMKLPKKVIVKDDTLREGEETPGAGFTVDEKVEIAKVLEETGIPEAEIGYAAGIREHTEAFKAIKAENLKLRLSSHARLYAEDVRKEVDDVVEAGSDIVNFLLVPDPVLKTEEAVFNRIIEGVECAKERGVYVAFGTGRTTPEYWKKFCLTAIEAGVDRIVAYDGNGCFIPAAFKNYVEWTKGFIGDVPVEVHCHDDLGLAVANTLSGVEGGAEVVDVVVNGLGDRAGNAALEEVVMALEILYGIDLGLKLDKLYELSKMVERTSRIPLQPHKAIVGENCFIHESDLHVEQMLTGMWYTWELYQPQVVGQTRKLVFGATTLQTRALRAKLTKMGLKPTSSQIEEIQNQIRKLLKQEKYVQESEIEKIAKKIVK